MTIQEAFLVFKDRVNRNTGNDDVSTDRGRFIQLFNEAQLRYVDRMLEKRHEDDIRYLESLVVSDLELTSGIDTLNHTDYLLPENYYDHINLQVFAHCGKCEAKLGVFENKSEDIEEFFQDPSLEPSFKARETFYTFGGKKLKVYFKDFQLSKVFLTYYRYPRVVDMEGYIKFDGSYSQDVHPEWDDKVVYRIITAATYLHNHNLTENPSLDKELMFSDF